MKHLLSQAPARPLGGGLLRPETGTLALRAQNEACVRMLPESDAHHQRVGPPQQLKDTQHVSPAQPDGDFRAGCPESRRERRRDLDVSSRVLSELASREAALDAQIEAAREEARREVEAAEAQAARILQDAQAQVQAMQAQHDQALAAETARIREDARRQAEEGAQLTRQRAGGRVQQAAEYILRAVLP